jgi:hypothetical protein
MDDWKTIYQKFTMKMDNQRKTNLMLFPNLQQ